MKKLENKKTEVFMISVAVGMFAVGIYNVIIL